MGIDIAPVAPYGKWGGSVITVGTRGMVMTVGSGGRPGTCGSRGRCCGGCGAGGSTLELAVGGDAVVVVLVGGGVVLVGGAVVVVVGIGVSGLGVWLVSWVSPASSMMP